MLLKCFFLGLYGQCVLVYWIYWGIGPTSTVIRNNQLKTEKSLVNGWVRELLTGGCDWLCGWGWAGGAEWAVMHASQCRNRMRLLTTLPSQRLKTTSMQPSMMSIEHRYTIYSRTCTLIWQCRIVCACANTHTHCSLHCNRWRLSVQPRVTTLAWCLQPLKFGAAAINIHYHPINTQFVVRLMLSGTDDRGCDPEVQGQWEGRVSMREARGSNKVTVVSTHRLNWRLYQGATRALTWLTPDLPARGHRFDWQGDWRRRGTGVQAVEALYGDLR